MRSETQIDRELLRKATLRFLAERFRLALDVGAICRLMEARHYVDARIDEEDVEQALVVLKQEGFVDEEKEPMGATPYFKITGKGIIANERMNP